MIKTQDVRDFFDRLAPDWDGDNEKDPEKLGRILDLAGIKKGAAVLDVACGTGVMIPFYLEREASRITAVDLSPEMARLTREKFPDPRVKVFCADAESFSTEERYSNIVVFNAFPHFPDGKRLIAHLTSLLAPGGVCIVAHDATREEIDAHHRGCASHVSCGLPPAEDLAGVFRESGLIGVIAVSDEGIYVVAGKKDK